MSAQFPETLFQMELNGSACAQEQPRLFRRLLDKAEGTRSSWEYPFAVAGINMTYMLEEVADLRDKRVGSLIDDRLPNSAAGRGFLSLLAVSSTVFETVSDTTHSHLENYKPVHILARRFEITDLEAVDNIIPTNPAMSWCILSFMILS